MSHKFFSRRSSSDKSNNNNNSNNTSKKDFSGRKAQLSPLEYKVTQERQTERPFSNKYNRFWEPGTYHCIVCNAELFKSNTKFESKSGWPAFSNVVDPKRVKLSTDLSHIGANLLLLITKPDLARTEVSCAVCNAHLGHLFKDGPKPTGLRYCINSSSLHFIAIPQGNSTAATDDDDDDEDENSSTAEGEGPPEEFPCNPYNSCGLPPREPPPKDGDGGKFRKSQTLPPMASLCLNNQSCQRGSKTPINTNVPQPQQRSEKLSHSNDALDRKILPEENNSSTSTKPKNANMTSTTTPTAAPIAYPSSSSVGVDNINNANNSSNGEFKRTFSSRYPSSKGASLTAARINFFQNLKENTQSKEKEIDQFAKWKNSLSSNPNSVRPFTNRFVSSSSSGSLKGIGNQKDQNENSNTTTRNGFTTSTSRTTEKISAPPTPLKETSL